MTDNDLPSPEIIAWRKEQHEEAERMRRIYDAALQRGTTQHDEADTVRILPGGMKVIGKPGGWSRLAARAHAEAAGRTPMTEEYHDPRVDPDTTAAEDRALGTTTRTIDKLDRRGPSIFRS